jgi:hypothetical protein
MLLYGLCCAWLVLVVRYFRCQRKFSLLIYIGTIEADYRIDSVLYLIMIMIGELALVLVILVRSIDEQ